MAFASLAQFKRHINWQQAGTAQDADLQMHLDSAEEQVTWMIGPSAPTVVTAERRFSTSERLIVSNAKNVTAVSAVTAVEGAVPVDVAEVVIEDPSGVLRRKQGRCFGGWYDLTYTGGWAAVTNSQTLATMIIGGHLWKLQNGRGRPATGEELVLVPGGFAVPARALELLRPYGAPTGVGGFA